MTRPARYLMAVVLATLAMAQTEAPLRPYADLLEPGGENLTGAQVEIVGQFGLAAVASARNAETGDICSGVVFTGTDAAGAAVSFALTGRGSLEASRARGGPR